MRKIYLKHRLNAFSRIFRVNAHWLIRIRSLRLVLAAILPLVGLGVFLIVRHIAQLIRTLTATAQTVTQVQLQPRVPPEGPLEVARTAPQINAPLNAQVRVGRASRETQDTYRDVFEGTQDILLLVDRLGNILDINHQAEVLTGYTQTELCTMNVFQDLIIAEDQPAMVQVLHDLTGGQRREYEVRWRAKDGRILYFSGASAARFSADGRFLSTICALRDITQRKQAEMALRDSEAKFRGLFNTVHSIILMVDRHGNILDVNGYAQEVLGYTPQELRHRNVFDRLYVPEDRPKMQQVIEDLIDGRNREYVTRWIAKDGHIVTFAGSSTSRFSADGEFLSTLCTYVDITEHKQAEETLQRNTLRLETLHAIDQGILAARSLAEIAEAVLHRIMDLVPCQGASINLLDFETRELIVYAARSPGESRFAAGTHVRFDDMANIDANLQALRQGQVVVSDDITTSPPSASLERAVAEGRRSYISAPLRFKGDLIGLLNLWDDQLARFGPDDTAIIREIADSLAVAINHVELFDEVTAGREQMRRLASRIVSAQEQERRHIAHELHDEIGQNLTAVKITLDLVDQLPDDQARTKLTEAARLVDELLDSIRNLSLDLRPAMLDDLGLLPTLQSYFERYTRQMNIQVLFKHNALDTRYAADVESATYRIVQEALTNVARHARVSEVTVRLWVDQDVLSVQIEDHGIGFDPDTAFVATDKSGLSGMRERAMLLGGQLSVESSPGQGTRLTAELPVDR